MARRSLHNHRRKVTLPAGGALAATDSSPLPRIAPASRTVAAASDHIALRQPRLCPRSHSFLQQNRAPFAPASTRAFGQIR